jgi:phage-related minor tail protein
MDGTKISFKEMVADLLKDMARLSLQRAVLQPLFGGGTSGSGALASGLTSLFGGTRASGGPVDAGRSYVVGEKGRELFVPSVPGQIVASTSSSSSMQMQFSPVFNVQNGTPEGVSMMRDQFATQLPGMMKRAMHEMLDRDPRFARLRA